VQYQPEIAQKKTQNINTLLKLKSLNIMKKKIILTLTACLFAAGSIINVHLAHNDHNLDVSLADISVMAQADGESGYADDYYSVLYWCSKICDYGVATIRKCEPDPGYFCNISNQWPCSCYDGPIYAK
jgi:hypothetical protein